MKANFEKANVKKYLKKIEKIVFLLESFLQRIYINMNRMVKRT